MCYMLSTFHVLSRYVANIGEPCLFFLNGFLGFAGVKHYQRITIPIFRLLQNFANPGYFPYILFSISIVAPYILLVGLLLQYVALFQHCWPFVMGNHTSQLDSFRKGPVMWNLGCLINAGVGMLNKPSSCRWNWDSMAFMWRHCIVLCIVRMAPSLYERASYIPARIISRLEPGVATNT